MVVPHIKCVTCKKLRPLHQRSRSKPTFIGVEGAGEMGHKCFTNSVSLVSVLQANVNSENMKLVAAILVAALYPNVVQISRPENKYQQSSAGAIPAPPKAQEIKFRTKQDGYVSMGSWDVSDVTLCLYCPK